MSRRLILSLTAIAVLLVVGAYVASPYAAVRSFVAAARNGDAARLNDAVDFPAVRKSLKHQMTEALTGRLKAKRGPFAGLGKLLAPVIVDQALDTLVTPESIAQLIRHGDPRPTESGPGKASARPLGYAYSYDRLDRFRVTLVSPDRPDSPGSLIFERRDLFWWKLVRVELPTNILAQRESDATL